MRKEVVYVLFFPFLFFIMTYRLRQLTVTLAALAALLTGITAAAAYTDVPSNAWYREAVDEFVSRGFLDTSQTRFRAADNANRAEFATLLIRVRGESLINPQNGNFNDVPQSAWYFRAIETAAQKGWIRGDGDCYGTRPCYARPAADISRAEAAALIVRAFELEPTGAAPRFGDNGNGQWYNTVIQTAADYCILQGDSSTRRVRPGDSMNRAEMTVMLQRAMEGLQYGSDCRAQHPESPAVEEARAVGPREVEIDFTVEIDADTADRINHYAIRGEDGHIPIESVTLISNRAVRLDLDRELEAGERYTLSVRDLRTADGRIFSASVSFTGFTPAVEGGALSASLSANNPSGATIPRGSKVTVLSVDLKASCDADISVDHLTVSHSGLGSQSDIEGLYAVIDGERRSRIRTVRSGNGTVDLRFTRPLVIPACKSERVDVFADIATDATAGSEHRFRIDRAIDIAASATDIRGQFPLNGNTFRVGSVTSGTVSFAYRTVTGNQVKVGDTAAVVGRFQLSADSAENQTIYSITLEQDGSASDGDLTNIRIRRSDGTVVTRSAQTTSRDFVTLFFDPPFVLREGDRLTFEIIADIEGGASETIMFRLSEPSDLFAIGSRYGSVRDQTFGSRVEIDTSSTPDTVVIDAGRLTVEIDGPLQRAYTRDTRDAVLGNVRFSNEGDPLEIRSMYVAVMAETSEGAGLGGSGDTGADDIAELINDVSIRNTATGRSVRATRLRGTDDAMTDVNRTYQIYRFDDLTINGNETWQLMVDFRDNGSGRHPLKGDRFAVSICTEPTHLQQGSQLVINTTGCDFGGLLGSASTTYQMQVESRSTGDRVADIRPRGTVSGPFHRISVPELVIAVQNTGSSEMTVRGAKDIPLMRFEARAGEATDILLTKAVFAAESGSLLNAQNYSLWVDTDNDGTVDTALERGVRSQNATVTFSQLTGGGYMIHREENVLFEVRADIATSVISDRIQLRFATALTGYIEAEEGDRGSTLSGIQTDGSCTAPNLCDILVRTDQSKLWKIVTQGNLFVRLDSSTIRPRQLLGGSTETVMRLEFRADNEPITVTDLQITSSGSSAVSVDRLELYRDGESSPFATATTGACGSDDVLTEWQGSAVRTFCAKMRNQQLVVPARAEIDVAIRARMKTDNDGAVSGEYVQFFLTGQPVANDATGSGAVRGYGLQSNGALAANDGDSDAEGEVFIGTSGGANRDIVSNPHDTVLSKITSVSNANPDSTGSNVPVGTVPMGQFRFTAATNTNSRGGLNEATLSGIIFTVSATNVELNGSSFRLYNKGDASARQVCTVTDINGDTMTGSVTGMFYVHCMELVESEVNTGISSGRDIVLVLEGTVISPNTSSTGRSTLQVSLENIATRSLTENGFGLNGSRIHWVDRDQSSTDFYWLDLPENTVQSTGYRS